MVMSYRQCRNRLVARRICCRAIMTILCVLAAACDSTPDIVAPTVADGTVVLVNIIDEKYGTGIVTVAEFRESDSKSVIYGTSIFHILEYEAELEFPEGISAAFEFKSDDDRFFFGISSLPRIVDQKKQVFSGKGWISFSLGEEGWHAPDGNIYQPMSL